MDALQAYICAVQFDKNHAEAWTNLGILYESCSQPRDALTCYLNASRAGKVGSGNPFLVPRIRYLQQQLAAAPMPSIVRHKTLMTIEEAWNMHVSQEMNQRSGGVRGNGGAGPKQQPPPYAQQQNDSSNKRFKADTSEQPRPQFYLNSQQIQLLQYLQQNQATINATQQQQLQHLQHNYRLMQQHQMQLRHQLQQQQVNAAAAGGGGNYGRSPVNYPASAGGGGGGGGAANGGTGAGQTYLSPRSHTPQMYGASTQYTTNGTATYSPQHNAQNTSNNNAAAPGTFYGDQQQPPPQGNSAANRPGSAGTTTLPDPTTTVSDQELQDLLSQKEFTKSFAEDLLNRIAKGENVMDEFNKGELDQTSLPNTQFSSSSLPDNSRVDSKMVKQEIDYKNDNLVDSGDLEGLPPEIKLESNGEIEITENMTGTEIVSACKSRGALARNMCMVGDNNPPPAPPDPPAVRLNKDQLVPPTASVLLEVKKMAFSPQLQEFCLKHPIAVVRGLASALKMDLGLFSTKTLVQTNPDHTIEVRTQASQPADKNIDPNNPDKTTWPCYSHRSHTTIAKYASYQASSFQESLKVCCNCPAFSV